MNVTLSDEELDELNLTREQAVNIVTPVYIGPTWQCDALGQWILPEHTLGWQIAGWCAEYLRGVNGGRWRFTGEQMRFVLWWYAVDEDGVFLHQTGVLQRCKGWGKDPLLAVLALVEFVGPCRFGGWDADGNPIGVQVRDALVQIAAVSREQTGNTMDMLPSLVTDHFLSAYGVESGIEKWRADGRRRTLMGVTSNYRALEGKRSTFVVLNETHHWVSGNSGHSMYETVDGNTTKMDGRYMAITNAFLPGEDSVAERMRQDHDLVMEGEFADSGLLYDSVEAKPKAPLGGPLLDYVLKGVRGDAVWLKPEVIKKSIRKKSIAASRSRRMWLNQVTADADALHGPDTWGVLKVDGAELMPGDEIVLGFDGGKTDDATALIAIRLSDNCVFLLGLWEKPTNTELAEDWRVNESEVDSRVHEAFATYGVRAFYADVALWETYIDDWAYSYGEELGVKASTRNAISWDMRSSIQRSTRSHERLMDAIFTEKLAHDGDLRLQRHVFNARRRNNSYGVSFSKESEESPRKVDAYAALMLAWEAAIDYRTNGKKTKRKTGRGVFL